VHRFCVVILHGICVVIEHIAYQLCGFFVVIKRIGSILTGMAGPEYVWYTYLQGFLDTLANVDEQWAIIIEFAI
jgi:hypothetical protein